MKSSILEKGQSKDTECTRISPVEIYCHPKLKSSQNELYLSTVCILPHAVSTSKKCWLLYNYSNFPPTSCFTPSACLLFVSRLKLLFFSCAGGTAYLLTEHWPNGCFVSGIHYKNVSLFFKSANEYRTDSERNVILVMLELKPQIVFTNIFTFYPVINALIFGMLKAINTRDKKKNLARWSD